MLSCSGSRNELHPSPVSAAAPPHSSRQPSTPRPSRSPGQWPARGRSGQTSRRLCPTSLPPNGRCTQLLTPLLGSARHKCSLQTEVAKTADEPLRELRPPGRPDFEQTSGDAARWLAVLSPPGSDGGVDSVIEPSLSHRDALCSSCLCHREPLTQASFQEKEVQGIYPTIRRSRFPVREE